MQKAKRHKVFLNLCDCTEIGTSGVYEFHFKGELIKSPGKGFVFEANSMLEVAESFKPDEVTLVKTITQEPCILNWEERPEIDPTKEYPKAWKAEFNYYTYFFTKELNICMLTVGKETMGMYQHKLLLGYHFLPKIQHIEDLPSDSLKTNFDKMMDNKNATEIPYSEFLSAYRRARKMIEDKIFGR